MDCEDITPEDTVTSQDLSKDILYLALQLLI